jgi:site-specific DNA recombinase
MNDPAEEIDITRLRYALYVRKSTDDKERQQRSIDDQIIECEELAAKLGIHLVKPYYRDDGSAKIPDNPKRQNFYHLLRDIRSGKIDGIMSWHPDRLARNMQDGGLLFGLLDSGHIQDMKFVTHYFTNDASGRMLLGISFTLATYYSANLSQNVKRGMRRSLNEGKSSGTPKHGYVRTTEGTYVPDGKNYELIVEAWQMRKNGMGLREIAHDLNSRGYGRAIKSTKSKKFGQKVTLTNQILSELFKDPFYYGVLIQTKKTIDLRDAYDFKPAVSEEDFNEVQRFTRSMKIPLIENRGKGFLPLRGMVKCSFCGRAMGPAPSHSRSGAQYLYYRCTTEGCERKKKSLRAKVVFDYIDSVLKDGLNLTDKDYNKYKNGLLGEAEARDLEINREINSKRGALKATKRRIDDISKKIIDYDKNSRVWQVNHNQLISLEKEEIDLQEQIKELELMLSEPEQTILSVEQFLNLSKNVSSKVKAADEVGKDRICRIIFLNLVADEEKIVSHHLKEPFKTALKYKVVLCGRGERTQTFDLSVPNRARYQLRHTPMCVRLG